MIPTVPSFNSLSRDHQKMAYIPPDAVPTNFQLPLSGSRGAESLLPFSIIRKLSTPSLGITRGLEGLEVGDEDARDEPFNSLSRDHPECLIDVWVIHIYTLSTPSLGITSLFRFASTVVKKSAFNSLSRDHRARFRDFPALRGFLPRHPFAQMNLEATI